MKKIYITPIVTFDLIEEESELLAGTWKPDTDDKTGMRWDEELQQWVPVEEEGSDPGDM